MTPTNHSQIPVDSVTLKEEMAIEGTSYLKLSSEKGFEIVWHRDHNVLVCKTPASNDLVISMKDVASLDVHVENADAAEARAVIAAFESAGKPRELN